MEEKKTKTHFDFFFTYALPQWCCLFPLDTLTSPCVLCSWTACLRHATSCLFGKALDVRELNAEFKDWECICCSLVCVFLFLVWSLTPDSLQWYIEFKRPLPLLWPEQCSQQCPWLPVHGVWWASTRKARTEACLFPSLSALSLWLLGFGAQLTLWRTLCALTCPSVFFSSEFTSCGPHWLGFPSLVLWVLPSVSVVPYVTWPEWARALTVGLCVVLRRQVPHGNRLQAEASVSFPNA